MQPQPAGNHFNNQQQQLQPFSGSGSNSAHTSPMKRAPQAVSPLASPMESRRVFMAHQQAIVEQQQRGQTQHQAMGISALQLGYAVPAPACRLLIDPQTGQQYFVPTAAHPLATPPAATAYFQPALFYNQPSAFYQPHHQHQHSHSATSTVTNTIGNPLPGTYLFVTSNRTPTHTSDAFYAHSSSTSNTAAAEFYASTDATHRSQSPMGRESVVAGGAPYRVEMPSSTVDDGDGSSIYRCDSDADRDIGSGQRGGGYGHQWNQEQHFQRLEQCRLSTESRGSSACNGGFYEEHHRQQQETNNPEEEEYAHGYHHHYPHSPPLLYHRQVPPQYNKPMPPSLQLNQNVLNHSPASQQMNLSIGGNGSSSESTSGIASGCRSRTRTFGDEPRSPPPTQSPLRKQQMLSSFPALREEQQQERVGRSPPPPARRAIRMDIDLSRPMSPPENARTTRPIGRGSIFSGGKQSTKNGGDNSASSVSVRATVLRATPPTAFTISFNDESTQLGQVSISETSLQDAARQAPKGRRLLLNRRSVPPRGGQNQSQQQQHDSGSECGGDPKRWLFHKMLQGRDEEREKGGTGKPGSIEQQQRAGEDDGDEENDADHEDLASEAGTYVIDKNAAAAAAMTISQISTQHQLDSDSNKSSCSSSSSSTSTATNSSRTASPRPKSAPKIRPSFPPANQTITPENVKRSLMGDLRRLRENTNSQPNPSPIMTPTNPTDIKSSTVPKLPPPISTQRKIQQHITTPVITVASSGPPNRPCRVSTGQQQQQAFRIQSYRCRSEPRNDGGRFSMRPSQQQQRPLSGLLKSGGSGGRGPVPIRQQSANATALSTKAQQPVQKSPEMLNWLRRKEYDPRKAAATTTTITDLKKANKAQSSIAPLAYAESTTSAENEEAFMANRSLSAVPSVSGATVTKLSAVKESPFARWRATQGGGSVNDRSASVNRSHDDLSRLGGAESLDEESLLGAAPDSCTSSLKRTVDELTQKCHKSIQSIINNSRLNQSTMSPSVEQLLERVAQSGAADDVLAGTIAQNDRQTASTFTIMPLQIERNKVGGGNSEDISDRLDRLNSAFDAIQKYLEEQTPSRRGSGNKVGVATTSTMKNENVGNKSMND